MRKALFAGVAVAALLTVGMATPAQASGHPPVHHHYPALASVSVLHAVPKVPVDVYLDHKRVLDDFQPGTLAGPLKVPAGAHKVAITAADAKNDRHPIIGPVHVYLKRHHDYTIVAHLTPKGAPTATVYNNTLKPTPKHTGRLIVRHVAAAPAVDVYANWNRIVKGLTNPHQAKLVVKAKTYHVAVTLAGQHKPVIGPAPVEVKKHTDTIVYAWGSAAQGNLTVAVQYVPVHRW